jgi:hypothetical protein
MNCRTAKKQILTRLDEVPSGEQEAALQQHLTQCDTCARVARESDLAFRWLQEAPAAEPSESFEWRLRLRLAQLDRDGSRIPLIEEAPVRDRWRLRFAVSAAAAAVLVLGVGLTQFDSQPAPGSSASVESEYSVPRLVNPSPVLDTRTVPMPRNDLPQVSWPRPVPVSHGAPLGPTYPQLPAPSILGPTRADVDSMEPQPARVLVEPR